VSLFLRKIFLNKLDKRFFFEKFSWLNQLWKFLINQEDSRSISTWVWNIKIFCPKLFQKSYRRNKKAESFVFPLFFCPQFSKFTFSGTSLQLPLNQFILDWFNEPFVLFETFVISKEIQFLTVLLKNCHQNTGFTVRLDGFETFTLQNYRKQFSLNL